MSNRAPETKWFSQVLASGVVRQRLYVDGNETPFFIDTSDQRSHRTYGDRHGLYGSGMGDMTSAGYRIAGCFGSARNIVPLKHRAEQMALSEREG